MGRQMLAAAAVVASVHAAELQETTTTRAAANPIRKVVTMLESIRKKVTAEGEQEEQLYKKYMCYCKSSGGDLQKSIADAETKAPAVTSGIQENEAKKQQLDDDLVQHKADRQAAKAAMAEARQLREKQAASFASEKADFEANIGAINKAVAALEKGMAGAFLQTPAAGLLNRLLAAESSSVSLVESDREELAAFLGRQASDYSPVSGGVTGILKQLGDAMNKDLAEASAEESASLEAFEELMAAKTKEVKALTASIETKTVRTGELAVEIVNMKNDLSDTQAALDDDRKFLKDLEQNCDTKTAEWDEIVKTRSEELVALSETIKLLQDDDALELFKKALPSAASSFLQTKVDEASLRARALQLLRPKEKQQRQQLAFVALALEGKKGGFEKVISMIDGMVELLKKEQSDDDSKKQYCAAEFDRTDDEKKGLERAISDADAAIADAEGAITTLADELKALSEGIKALDRSVAEATEQRRSENQDFKELMAQDSAAKELLGIAKNRLNKFYNPKLYLPPPKRDLTEEERITQNFGGSLAPTPAPGGIAGTGVTVLAEVSVHRQRSSARAAPPAAPESPGAYSKKGQETTGVVAMMDLLVKDLDKEMQEAETSEQNAQADYEKAMQDASAKRAADSKALSDKEAAKADTEAALQSHKDGHASSTKELAALSETIAGLHAECDWLLQYFDARKQARESEMDSLAKAKAVLSGADFSLLQLERKHLRGL